MLVQKNHISTPFTQVFGQLVEAALENSFRITWQKSLWQFHFKLLLRLFLVLLPLCLLWLDSCSQSSQTAKCLTLSRLVNSRRQTWIPAAPFPAGSKYWYRLNQTSLWSWGPLVASAPMRSVTKQTACKPQTGKHRICLRVSRLRQGFDFCLCSSSDAAPA